MDEITFDNAPTGYPISRERIKFETELTKNAKSPKKALELPASDFSQKAIVDYGKFNKLASIRHGDAYYLFDRKQISEPEVRKRLASGQLGTMLGYSEDTIPENGTQVALSIDGSYSDDPQEILEWRNSDNLGLTWSASDPEKALQTAAAHLGVTLQDLTPEESPEKIDDDYPQVWLQRQTLPAKTWVEDQGKYETVDTPAIDVLNSYKADLNNIDKMLLTLQGGNRGAQNSNAQHTQA